MSFPQSYLSSRKKKAFAIVDAVLRLSLEVSVDFKTIVANLQYIHDWAAFVLYMQ